MVKRRRPGRASETDREGRGIAMKIIIAPPLQTSLARSSHGRGHRDLVFVRGTSRSAGPTPDDCRGGAGVAGRARASGTLSVGIGAGTVARRVSRIGSIAKTVVGFFAGVIGRQFIVARPLQGRSSLHGDSDPCDQF